MVEAATETDITDFTKKAYEAINAEGAKKAEFALNILYLENPKNLNAHKYIEEGLIWVRKQLQSAKNVIII